MVCEEADICLRLRQAGGRILYQPGAVVEHAFALERLSPRWLHRRFFYQGKSEAFLSVRYRGLAAAAAKVGRGARHVSVGQSWHRARSPELRACRRWQSFGFVVGVAESLLRYRAVRWGQWERLTGVPGAA
jgi:GT2 family glycosyltransferase